jgi:predicted RNA-binding protein with PUA-like domain
MKHWLFKSEPETYGIDHLDREPRKTTAWDGVRNYQVRNMLRDEVSRGDEGFLYHSSCDIPGIVGIVKVVRAAYPDASAFDPDSRYFDAKSDAKNPRWFCVDVKLIKKIEPKITLNELRSHENGALADMLVLKRGNRLSITPVTNAEWKFILDLR